MKDLDKDIRRAHEVAELRFRILLRETKSSPETIARKLDKLGPDGLLIDALGVPGRNLGRFLFNTSYRAEEVMTSVVSKREAGRSSRVVGTLRDITGVPSYMTPKDMHRSTTERSRPPTSAAYGKARKAGKDFDSKIFDDLMNDPEIKKAYKQGKLIASRFALGKYIPTDYDNWCQTPQRLSANATAALKKNGDITLTASLELLAKKFGIVWWMPCRNTARL